MQSAITVGHLKKALKNVPDNLPLVYAIDDEGNDYKFVYFLGSMKMAVIEDNRIKDIHEEKTETPGKTDSKPGVKVFLLN